MTRHVSHSIRLREAQEKREYDKACISFYMTQGTGSGEEGV